MLPCSCSTAAPSSGPSYEHVPSCGRPVPPCQHSTAKLTLQLLFLILQACSALCCCPLGPVCLLLSCATLCGPAGGDTLGDNDVLTVHVVCWQRGVHTRCMLDGQSTLSALSGCAVCAIVWAALLIISGKRRRHVLQTVAYCFSSVC